MPAVRAEEVRAEEEGGTVRAGDVAMHRDGGLCGRARIAGARAVSGLGWMEPSNPEKTVLSQVVGASDLGLRRPKML